MARKKDETYSPVVYGLKDFRAEYKGRAQANIESDYAIVIVKSDGHIIVHEPTRNIKPILYNQGGLSIEENNGKAIIYSRNKLGESVYLSGTIQFSNKIPVGASHKSIVRMAKTLELRVSLTDPPHNLFRNTFYNLGSVHIILSE
jgi:hypothetical protein